MKSIFCGLGKQLMNKKWIIVIVLSIHYKLITRHYVVEAECYGTFIRDIAALICHDMIFILIIVISPSGHISYLDDNTRYKHNSNTNKHFKVIFTCFIIAN